MKPKEEARRKCMMASHREQMQEEIICFIDSYGFLSHPEFLKDNLCQIVVDGFAAMKEDVK